MIEHWRADAMKLGEAVVMYQELQPGYIWIYFAYSPTSREFYHLYKEFIKRFPCAIIEFRTSQPWLFKNHSKLIHGDHFQYAKRGDHERQFRRDRSAAHTAIRS